MVRWEAVRLHCRTGRPFNNIVDRGEEGEGGIKSGSCRLVIASEACWSEKPMKRVTFVISGRLFTYPAILQPIK